MAKTTKDELKLNAFNWAKVAKETLPPDVAFIFFFCPKGGAGEGSSLCVSNLVNAKTVAEIESFLKKYSDGLPRILSPHEAGN